MRERFASIIVAGLLCVCTQPAFAQAKAVSDPICPSAVPAIKAIAAISDPTNAVKVGEAADNAVRAYKDCAAGALAAGAIEPNAHYDETRASSYEVIYGRALLGQGKYDEAHAAFEDAAKLSGLVADWVAPAYGYTNSNKNADAAATINGGSSNAQGTEHNSGQNKSQFRDAATEIRKAAQAELAKLVPTSPKP